MAIDRVVFDATITKAKGFQKVFADESKRGMVVTISNGTAASVSKVLADVVAQRSELLNELENVSTQAAALSADREQLAADKASLTDRLTKLEQTIRTLNRPAKPEPQKEKAS